MKKVLVLLMSVLFLASAAWGHVPEDRLFLAFQWPDNAVPTIDGNLDEWSIIPEVYVLTLEDTHEALYPEENNVNKADLDFRGYIAYNDASDKMIMASSVFDDEHERDNTDPGQCSCSDDNFEMWIDGDHAGDPYRAEYGSAEGATDEEVQRATNSTLQWWSIAVPPVGGRDVQSGNTGQWQDDPPYFDFAFSFTGEQFGESTYFYEMSFTVWDDLDHNGPDTSIPSTLDEGEIIGINVIWSDYDGSKATHVNEDGTTTYDGYWITGGPCCDGVNASDFLLAPLETDLFATAVETETWGRLKSRFR
jgi:hypothetical protein